jgi:hypothetical protein
MCASLNNSNSSLCIFSAQGLVASNRNLIQNYLTEKKGNWLACGKASFNGYDSIIKIIQLLLILKCVTFKIPYLLAIKWTNETMSVICFKTLQQKKKQKKYWCKMLLSAKPAWWSGSSSRWFLYLYLYLQILIGSVTVKYP